MFAVVEIEGKQYKVSPKDVIAVEKLPNKSGDKLSFDRILVLSDGKKTTVGTPVLEGHKVEAKVVDTIRDDKVIVFKKKRRKGFQVKRGHRQVYTTIEITKIF